jgi:electron transfer flavoprotein beta subunit
MKIVVCVKQIRYIYARTGRDPKTHFIAEEDRIDIVNPCDELAVEEAIRIKEELGDGEVILVTLGDLIAEKPLKRCLAMGADRLIQINDPSFSQLDPWGSSVVLARAIERLGPDLIFCGKEALDENGGQVGAYIADLLGLPYVSCVVKLDLFFQERKARIHRALGKGDKEVVEAKVPALFSVEEGPNEPRYPTLPNLLWALGQKIECWDRELLGLQISDFQPMTEVVEVHYPRPRPKRIAVPDSRLEAFDRIQQLLMGSRIEKKGAILQGGPESQAEGIISFLEEHGFLESKKVTKKE